MKIISVARKLSTTEKRSQDRSYLFQRRDYNKAATRRSVLGSSPNEDGFCSSEAKYDTKIVPRSKLFPLGDYRKIGGNPRNLSGVQDVVKFFATL
jgi:hypothetical protein